jgi:hydrogenase expression/formation protein HypC
MDLSRAISKIKKAVSIYRSQQVYSLTLYPQTLMCLAIPGKTTSIRSQLDETFRIANVSFGGIVKEVNLSMVPEASIGDYVLVHVGVAIGVVDEKEAQLTFNYLKQIGEVDELHSSESP